MALIKAINHNDIDLAIELLQDREYDPNQEDSTGKTPLIVILQDFNSNDNIYNLMLQHPKLNINYQSTGPGTVVRKKAKHAIEKSKIIGDFTSKVPNSWTCLHWCVVHKKLKQIHVLVTELYCDVNVQDTLGVTALHIACEVKDAESARVITQAPSCDVNIQDICRETALHWSASNGCSIITKMILENESCDINIQDQRERTALHNAAEHGHIEVSKYLLSDQRCHRNCRDYLKRAPIHLAATENKTEILKLFLDDQRSIVNARDRQGLTCLHEAALLSHAESVQVLLDSGRCLVNDQKNTDKMTPLHYALGWGQNSIVRLNHIDGHDLSDNDLVEWIRQQQVKQMQAGIDHAKTVQLFLKHDDCDINLVNKFGETPLHKCLFSAIANNVDYVLDELEMIMTSPHVRPSLFILNNEGQSAILSFFEKLGDTSKFIGLQHLRNYLRIMLTRSEGVNTSPQTLATAVRKSSASICAELIQYSADVNSSFDANETALHCAVHQESIPKVQLLVQNGADLETKWRGLTPLQYSITRSTNSKIIATLAENVPMNTIQNYLEQFSVVGETPLTCAIRLEVTSWIEYFARKENVNKPDETGLSAIDISCKHDKALDIVLQYNEKGVLEHELHEMRSWYAFIKHSSTTISLNNANCDESDATDFINFLKRSEKQSKEKAKETQEIIDAVFSLIACVIVELRNTPDVSHFVFRPLLAGSMAEGTKTYMPNELDIICEFLDVFSLENRVNFIKVIPPSPWERMCSSSYGETDEFKLDPMKVTREFYDALVIMLRSILEQGLAFGHLHLLQYPFILRDKISCMQLLWRGNIFKDMMIFVDLVPSFLLREYKPKIPLPIQVNTEYHFIAKVSRLAVKTIVMPMEVSYSRAERAMILALPSEIRDGLTTAKTLRNASVCRPDNIDVLGLEDDISSEDFITSYMLKTCLFHAVAKKDLTTLHGSRLDYADLIYDTLESFLLQKRIPSYHEPNMALFECFHEDEDQRDACCLRANVILTLCQTIRRWIQTHRSSFENWNDNPEKFLVYSRSRAIFQHLLCKI